MLKAENRYEEIIMNYVQENASDFLLNKIETSGKTMRGCLDFIKNQVRHNAINGCAMVEDKEVFGLAMHYFEEDDIKEIQRNTVVNKTDTPKEKHNEVLNKPKKATDAELTDAIDLFKWLSND